jgi:hypothetical protein
LVTRKEQQLRQLRVALRKTPFGRAFDEFISVEAAELGDVLLRDEDAFGLTVRTLEPWLRKRTNYDIFESEIDKDTVLNATRLLKLLSRRAPRLRPQLEALHKAIAAAEGTSVRKL